MEYKYVELNKLVSTTTNIIAMADRTQLSTATGFLYYGCDELVLVTNRHVVIKEGKSFFPDRLIVRMHIDEVDLSKNENFTIPLYDEAGKPRWLEHPKKLDHPELLKNEMLDTFIDVVCVKIDKNSKLFNVEKTSNIKLASKDQLSPSIHPAWIDRVVSVGYPLGYYDNIHNLPMLKTGFMASPYGVLHRGAPLFLVDSVAKPGVSGSPVFTEQMLYYRHSDGSMKKFDEPQQFFLGILSASLIDMSVVWYAYLIDEILKANYNSLLQS